MDIMTFVAAQGKDPSKGEVYNPWLDKSFNSCSLDPEPEDWEEAVGLEEPDHSFLDLTDVSPTAYLGSKGKAVIVNDSEDGLLFGQALDSGCHWLKIGNMLYWRVGSVGVGKIPDQSEFWFEVSGNLGVSGRPGQDDLYIDAVGVL